MELSTSYRSNRQHGESFDIFVLELVLEESGTEFYEEISGLTSLAVLQI
jgi:hypothetical protein